MEHIGKIRINTYNNKCKEVAQMPMTSKEMIKLLKDNGFVEVKGGKGSHRKFENPKTGKATVVPFHSKDLKKGTAV
ncbi:toxin-antitoxin system, toxin component, HicA family [Peptostreptococcus anaerobius VPI 4330 = DSM 2949]|nr:toxin-antitoxin system, toxin component, HicA family [Peptostreptococcus anaerobius VPI 4330 = DSM 2949]